MIAEILAQSNTVESRYNDKFGKHQNYRYNEIYHYIETHLVLKCQIGKQ